MHGMRGSNLKGYSQGRVISINANSWLKWVKPNKTEGNGSTCKIIKSLIFTKQEKR